MLSQNQQKQILRIVEENICYFEKNMAVLYDLITAIEMGTIDTQTSIHDVYYKIDNLQVILLDVLNKYKNLLKNIQDLCRIELFRETNLILNSIDFALADSDEYIKNFQKDEKSYNNQDLH